jgi:hypothetical protein
MFAQRISSVCVALMSWEEIEAEGQAIVRENAVAAKKRSLYAVLTKPFKPMGDDLIATALISTDTWMIVTLLRVLGRLLRLLPALSDRFDDKAELYESVAVSRYTSAARVKPDGPEATFLSNLKESGMGILRRFGRASTS